MNIKDFTEGTVLEESNNNKKKCAKRAYCQKSHRHNNINMKIIPLKISYHPDSDISHTNRASGVYIYIYIYIYVCVCVCVYIYICTYVYLFIYIYGYYNLPNVESNLGYVQFLHTILLKCSN